MKVNEFDTSYFNSSYELEENPIIRSSYYSIKNCIEMKSKTLCSAKIIDLTHESKSGENAREARIEADIMKNILNHTNIVKLLSIFRSQAYFILLTEPIYPRNLNDFLISKGTLVTQQIRVVMNQLLSAVKYLHKKMIVHRSIKLETIMIDDNLNLKLIDFSRARIINNDNELSDYSEQNGSLYYISPEVVELMMKRRDDGYGRPVDLWSLGIIMGFLLTRTFIFWDRNLSRMMQLITTSFIDFSHFLFSSLHSNTVHFLQRLLCSDPERRITAAKALEHCFFQTHIFKGPKVTKKKHKLKIYVTLIMAIFIMKKLSKEKSCFYEVNVNSPNNRAYSNKQVRGFIDKLAFEMYSHWSGTSDDKQKSVLLFQTSPNIYIGKNKKKI